VFLFGEERLGPKAHWFAAFLVFAGSWLSGFFIIATDASMQHPTGYHTRWERTARYCLPALPGCFSIRGCSGNTSTTLIGSVVTASFVTASVGAFYLLTKRSEEYGRTFVRLGVIAGMIFTFLMAFPTGDGQAKNIAWYQPPTLAAMEGLFETERGAPLAIIGQPDLEKHRLAVTSYKQLPWGAPMKLTLRQQITQFAHVLQTARHGSAALRVVRTDATKVANGPIYMARTTAMVTIIIGVATNSTGMSPMDRFRHAHGGERFQRAVGVLIHTQPCIFARKFRESLPPCGKRDKTQRMPLSPQEIPRVRGRTPRRWVGRPQFPIEISPSPNH
jgi:cytochrome bd-type quinol oxidase subunit 1